MIDIVKMENAAFEAHKSQSHKLDLHSAFSLFKAGVEWANEQFVKNLWHDASEEPYDFCDYLVKTKQGYIEVCFYNNNAWSKLNNEGDEVTMWLAIEDIFPKNVD